MQAPKPGSNYCSHYSCCLQNSKEGGFGSSSAGTPSFPSKAACFSGSETFLRQHELKYLLKKLRC